MTPQTEVLLAVAAQNGAVTGDWYAAKPARGRDYVPFNIEISGTSATVVLEGRNHPSDAAATVISATASEAFRAQHFNQYRVRVSAATDANIRVTTDEPLRECSSDGLSLA